MKIKVLFRRFLKARAQARRQTQARHRQARPEPAHLEQLAIERLASLGTERGSALAMEIQRGIERRNDRLR
jgi:macrodomain Ter protein organizer (MatP/YcbG family)